MLILCLGFPATVSAVNDIVVMGLFRARAVLLIDGQRRVLSAGEQSPEGVTLVSASSTHAVLEIDGKQHTYSLGSRVSASFAKIKRRTISIYRSPQGMYTTVGSINGLPVKFLIDTGASAVAMSAIEAKRLGVNYKLEGERTQVRTASGISAAYRVQLNTIKVGEILQRNVNAFVIEGN